MIEFVVFICTASNQIYEEHSPDLFGEPSGGDESGCVKPWLGAVKIPKNPPPINPGVPGVKMKLKWVHGYASGTVYVWTLGRILFLCFCCIMLCFTELSCLIYVLLHVCLYVSLY